MDKPIFTVSDFVAVYNQVIDNAFGLVVITGELSNFRVSKNRWVYFDLKDEHSSVAFFGSVYCLPGPLEDGVLLTVTGSPRLSNKYGFSISVQSILLSGEGSINRTAKLLEAKLRKQGLFSEERKRALPYPPNNIGLITSAQSAAYADFVKIIRERWPSVAVSLQDVQVQGEQAVSQITAAINYFNEQAHIDLDALVIVRGGGSPDDLQAFNHEQVVRSIAGSRLPTLVAIGHETDVSLAELAADKRASTPSNAAEMLVPSREAELNALRIACRSLDSSIARVCQFSENDIRDSKRALMNGVEDIILNTFRYVNQQKQLLETLSPKAVLARGYAIVRQKGKVITQVKNITDTPLHIELKDGVIEAQKYIK